MPNPSLERRPSTAAGRLARGLQANSALLTGLRLFALPSATKWRDG
jgi:hypothetical protein